MDAIDKKKLRAEAHVLKPVILIGQLGLTDAVLAEIEQALQSHELIKVKIRAERDDRAAIQQRMCIETGAELVQTIGRIAVIYRRNPQKIRAQTVKPGNVRQQIKKSAKIKAGKRR